ncbi:MAG: flagellar basal body-associated FliL family protein [Alphaproteobacteria bacterium]
MSSTELTSDEAEGEGVDGEGEAPARKKRAGKKLILFIAAPVVLLLAAAGGLFATGMIGGGGGEDDHAEATEVLPPVFFEMPEMLVNLASDGRRSNFLKVQVSLEVGGEHDIPRIKAAMPRIVDSFNAYLRDLRLEDLQGSAGIYRLREELLLRVTQVAAPAEVRDVLFTEMLVQ